jgi:hypothetical protein
MGCRGRYPKPPNSPKKSCACAIDVKASAANIAVPQSFNLPDFFPESCCAMTCLAARRASRLPTVATNATALEQFRLFS